MPTHHAAGQRIMAVAPVATPGTCRTPSRNTMLLSPPADTPRSPSLALESPPYAASLLAAAPSSPASGAASARGPCCERAPNAPSHDSLSRSIMRCRLPSSSCSRPCSAVGGASLPDCSPPTDRES